MQLLFPALIPQRLSGNEPFSGSEAVPQGMNVLSFWRWAASNLVDNTTRGLLAEFIVARALGLDDGIRSAWDAYDLRTSSGLKIEVKCSAYLQAWGHKELSQIRFSIRPARAWDAQTNVLATEMQRHSDLYVLCLLKHQDKATLDPLNLDQWEFYVIPTSVLNERCGTAKGISLKALQLMGVQPVTFDALRHTIRNHEQTT